MLTQVEAAFLWGRSGCETTDPTVPLPIDDTLPARRRGRWRTWPLAGCRRRRGGQDDGSRLPSLRHVAGPYRDAGAAGGWPPRAAPSAMAEVIGRGGRQGGLPLRATAVSRQQRIEGVTEEILTRMLPRRPRLPESLR